MEAASILPFILLGLLVNSVIATAFLFFVPADTDVYRHRSIRYFRAYFILSCAAYVALAFRQHMPEVLSVFLANALVLSAAYCVVFALYWRYRLVVYLRQHPAPLHIILFSLVQVAQAHYFPEHAQVRLILVYVNVTAVLIYSLIIFSRHGEQERKNERVLMWGVSATAFGVFLVPLSYFASPNFTVFLVMLLLLQNTITLMLFGTFLSTIMYDYIFLYQRRAGQDSLTGALNRANFVEYLNALQEKEKRLCGSFMVVSIDQLSLINRLHSEAFGDEVLRFLCKLLQNAVHAGDVLCRSSGSEFTVYLSGASSENAMRIAQKLRASCQKNIQLHMGQSVECTFSVGVAETQTEQGHIETWRQATDAAQRAKRAGGDRVERAVDCSGQGQALSSKVN